MIPGPDKPLTDDSRKLAIHGVLLEIFGIGVLLIGEAGIGKSETALEMVRRGHRLVADDAVKFSIRGRKLIGAAPAVSFKYLEVRGLGIVNIRELFGPESVLENAAVELCIELIKPAQFDPVDRIGPAISEHKLLDFSIPKFTVPAGRDVSTLVETAVRVFILGNTGFDASRQLIEKHASLISSKL